MGNIRLSYTDNNDNLDIVEENNYYPFGLRHQGYNNNINGVQNNHMTFNGKEREEGLGLDWLYYGNRTYIPDIGRWAAMDPVAESYFTYSPYNYVRNNPILRIDPNGNWDITIHVSNDREQYGYGVAVVTDKNGNEVYRFSVRAEGIGGRNRLVTNSDTPLGTYDIPDENMWIAGGSSTAKRKAYGPNHRLILVGESGEIIDSGRDLIRIHGGRQEVYNRETGEWEQAKSTRLKKTKGCLRCFDSDILTLKSITDALQEDDSEEKGGKVTIINDLDTFLEDEQHNSEDESNEETAAFWKGLNNALKNGLDNLKIWLNENGF